MVSIQIQQLSPFSGITEELLWKNLENIEPNLNLRLLNLKMIRRTTMHGNTGFFLFCFKNLDQDFCKRIFSLKILGPIYEIQLINLQQKIADVLKNFKVIRYRQWVVEYFNLFSPEEMDFADSHLKEDLRNNSAWNYRYFICLNLSDRFQQNQFLQSEIEFVNFLFH